MISGTELTSAIESVLSTYPGLSGVTIERSVTVNSDPASMPWCGIYPGEFEIDPATLGVNSRRWKRTYKPKIILQEQSFDYEGQEASEKLEGLINYVLEAVASTHNTSLSFGLTGTRLMSVSGAYSYSVSSKVDDLTNEERFFPECEITLTVEVRE